jgi:hypothetical protein
MGDFWFYIELGLGHVLDLRAYDHILFLTALAIPFTFRLWKRILTLVTIFTVAHCFSLTLSVYDLLQLDEGLIEFLIPITILITALFNVKDALKRISNLNFLIQISATAFFGLIHGLGFSNYFKMLIAGQSEKATPLLGFATGIEIAQVVIIMGVLLLALLMESGLKIKKQHFILVTSIGVILITIPMIFNTWPF